MGNSKLCDLDLADDIALLADFKENMRKVTSELSNQAAALGLQFTVRKTKIMEVGRDISGEGISINGEDIEIVEDFFYLGSFISDNSNCDKEIRSRFAKANSIFGRLGKIWVNMCLSNVNKFGLYLRGTRFINATSWIGDLAYNGGQYEENRGSTSQMAEKDFTNKL